MKRAKRRLEAKDSQNTELKGLVMKALQENLEFSDLPVDVQNDREFVLAATREGEVSWYDLPKQRKNDAEIACNLFKRRNGGDFSYVAGLDFSFGPPVEWKDLPYHLKLNEKALLHALRAEGGPQWEEIPIQFQTNDITFAKSISCFVDKELPKEMLYQFVELRQDRRFWRKFLLSTELGEKRNKRPFRNLFAEYGTAELLL